MLYTKQLTVQASSFGSSSCRPAAVETAETLEVAGGDWFGAGHLGLGNPADFVGGWFSGMLKGIERCILKTHLCFQVFKVRKLQFLFHK